MRCALAVQESGQQVPRARGRRGQLLRSVLAVVAITALAALVRSAPVGAVALGPRFLRVGLEPQLSGARTVGSVRATKELVLDVALAPSHAMALDALATGVSTPGSPDYHAYLSRAEFVKRFAPSEAGVRKLEGDLRREGFKIDELSANDLMLKVSASAGTVERSWHLGLDRFVEGKREGFAPTARPLLPGSDAAMVEGVVGLDSFERLASPLLLRHQVAPHVQLSAKAVAGAPEGCVLARASGITADQTASVYGFDPLYQSGDFGQGTTIALYELEGFSASDIAAYQNCYSTAATVTAVPVDGYSPSGPGSGEASLDIEMLIGMAPRATIEVYEAPNVGSGPLDAWEAIVSSDTAKVVSTSWGECEAETDLAVASGENTLFEEAAVQGQSIVAASGDSGSAECSPASQALAVSDPSSQPDALSVGGTTLDLSGSSPTQSAWSGSGGGISSYWPMPTWQVNASSNLGVVSSLSSGAPCGASQGNCREVPDVSIDADLHSGYAAYYNGLWYEAGGTSAAAPIWASIIALADSNPACIGPVGLVAPVLYSTSSDAADYSSSFTDITSGNNDSIGTNGGLYPATPGYNMATGLGTPNADAIAQELCSGTYTPPASPDAAAGPELTEVVPAAGPSSGGNRVALVGLDLSGVKAVRFGSSVARVLKVGPTRVVVVAPTGRRAVGVVVETRTGAVRAKKPTGYSYVAGPLVTTLSPRAGSPKGATTVTLYGSRLTGASVRFGRHRATIVTDSASEIVVATPPGHPGTRVDVTVLTAGGRSALSGRAEFSYRRLRPAATSPSDSNSG